MATTKQELKRKKAAIKAADALEKARLAVHAYTMACNECNDGSQVRANDDGRVLLMENVIMWPIAVLLMINALRDLYLDAKNERYVTQNEISDKEILDWLDQVSHKKANDWWIENFGTDYNHQSLREAIINAMRTE